MPNLCKFYRNSIHIKAVCKTLKIVQNLQKSPLCILKGYCLVAIMDLLWQLLFGWSYNFRSYGLKWGKKENYFSCLKYIFLLRLRFMRQIWYITNKTWLKFTRKSLTAQTVLYNNSLIMNFIQTYLNFVTKNEIKCKSPHLSLYLRVQINL